MERYLLDIGNNELTVSDLVKKYHPNSLKDSIVKRTFSDLYTGLRKDVQIQNLKAKPIISIEDLPEELSGLDIIENENRSIFLVFDDKRCLFPVLVKDGEILSTIIMTKGKRKYFLII